MRDPCHLLLRHALVCLVLEVRDRPAPGVNARRADEGRDRTRLVAGNGGRDRVQVDRIRSQSDVATGHRWYQRQLVAVRKWMVAVDILLVQGVEDTGRLVLEFRYRSPHVPHATLVE